MQSPTNSLGTLEHAYRRFNKGYILRGVLYKVLYGEAPPWGPTSYSFYIPHFGRKGTPLSFIEKLYPFYNDT